MAGAIMDDRQAIIIVREISNKKVILVIYLICKLIESLMMTRKRNTIAIIITNKVIINTILLHLHRNALIF